MILASAQTKPKRGDVNANLKDHFNFVEVASTNGADLIVFPEMSITGYERVDAKKLCFVENDPRLDRLKKLAVYNRIIIVAGAPVMISNNLFIGSFIISTDGNISIYTKQFLHGGEEPYFKPSFDHNPTIEIGDQRASFAICFDIENPLHLENASKAKSSLYIPSIFYTPKGIPEAHELLSEYARKYSMNILMSNFCGPTWEMEAGGGSAFWDIKGNQIASLDGSDTGLVIVQKDGDVWSGKTIVVNV